MKYLSAHLLDDPDVLFDSGNCNIPAIYERDSLTFVATALDKRMATSLH